VRGARPASDQERELVVAAERGDKAACRELVDTFLPAIAHVARRFESGGARSFEEPMGYGPC
jgi:DNA-directed RNA polymerase specialized sigma subunit